MFIAAIGTMGTISFMHKWLFVLMSNLEAARDATLPQTYTTAPLQFTGT